ncbi:hypothetical protein BJ742DRAFT_854659 [Cladochytrium replicatum]|nr:hypothetical protein BJ742DRAFT_854659 [Cladochytrium replicatum]
MIVTVALVPLLFAILAAGYTANGVKGTYWSTQTDPGGCQLPTASYSTALTGAIALGQGTALGPLAFVSGYCGQVFQITCNGRRTVNAIIASTCNIGSTSCGVDMIAKTWNAATNNASPGITSCTVSNSTVNPISSSSGAVCYYRPGSEFNNEYYKLLSVLNTGGRILKSATAGGATGALSSGNWYAFSKSKFAATDQVVFTYTDGSRSVFTLSSCVKPSGVQIFS